MPPGSPQASRLAVLVDGESLPDDEARALWARFSAWMEDHRGDLAGFAQREGFASVHPGVRDGRAVLLVSRVTPQRPYAPAAHQERDSGGSDGRQKLTQSHRRSRRDPRR
jgi:hypothetical protein